MSELAQLVAEQGLGSLKESTLPVRLVERSGSGKLPWVSGGIQNNKQRKLRVARLELAGRLLNAQEVERARIARELHDDIGQSIAMLSMQLQMTALILKGASKEGVAALEDLHRKMGLLGDRVTAMSHQLHSSELELLGLATAAKGLCREFSERYGIQVSYRCGRISEVVDIDIATGLFRILQEALRNVTKHSHAKNVKVDLYEVDGSLCLKCVDDGEGFESNQAFEGLGLGLTNMRERACLLGGRFKILSRRGFGTTVEARVPSLDRDGSHPVASSFRGSTRQPYS